MCFKKLMAIFLLITLAGRIAIAEEKVPEFTRVVEGNSAPFTGYLFTPAAITKIITTAEEDKKRAIAECQAETASVTLDLTKETELRTAELNSSSKLLTDIKELKDREIRDRDRKISLLEGDKVFSNILIVGSFLAGAALTAGIVYAVSGVVK